MQLFEACANLMLVEEPYIFVTDNPKLSPILPTGMKHRCKPEVDIIYWRNKDVPINTGNLFALIFGLIFVVVFILYFSYQIFAGGLDNRMLIEQVVIIFFYMISWLPLLGILAAFQSLTWSEAIKISDTDITVLRSGYRSPKNKQFNKNIVLGIAFLRYKLDGKERVPSLNVLFHVKKAGGSSVDREIIGTWIRTKEKYQLFLVLQHILQKRGWEIDYTVKDRPNS